MATRKYASGYEKLKKIIIIIIESQKWSMDKFVISNKQNTTQNLDENITNEQEIHRKELENNEMIQLQDNNNVQFCNTTNLDNELQKKMLEKFEYKILISQFASQKGRKINFKWNIL